MKKRKSLMLMYKSKRKRDGGRKRVKLRSLASRARLWQGELVSPSLVVVIYGTICPSLPSSSSHLLLFLPHPPLRSLTLLLLTLLLSSLSSFTARRSCPHVQVAQPLQHQYYTGQRNLDYINIRTIGMCIVHTRMSLCVKRVSSVGWLSSLSNYSTRVARTDDIESSTHSWGNLTGWWTRFRRELAQTWIEVIANDDTNSHFLYYMYVYV